MKCWKTANTDSAKFKRFSFSSPEFTFVTGSYKSAGTRSLSRVPRITALSDMNMKYDVTAAALLSHSATLVLQLQDCLWRLVMLHLIHALPLWAIMALLRTAIWSEIVDIDYWLRLLLDIESVPQENVNNLKRKFQHCRTIIRARLVITVQRLPVRQGEWEPTTARASLHLPQCCQHSSSVAKLSCNRLWLISSRVVSAYF